MPNHNNSRERARRPREETREPNFPGRNFRHDRCPDCELEERLNIVGQPIFLKDIGIQKTLGCETCGGTGHVNRIATLDGVGIDPYEIPRRG